MSEWTDTTGAQIPRIRCDICQHVGNYAQLPAHWCEYFTPGKLNLHYPKPLSSCPRVKHDVQLERINLRDFA